MPYTYTDEQLAAFVDDELDKSFEAEISAAVGQSDDLKARVQEIRHMKQRVMQAFEEYDADLPPFNFDTLNPGQPQADREQSPAHTLTKVLLLIRKPLPLGAVTAFCLMVAAVFITLPTFNETGQPNFTQMYATLYEQQGRVSQTQWRSAFGTDREKFERLSFFSNQAEIDLTRFSKMDELSFLEAKFLNLEGNSVIQVSFISPYGEDIAFYLQKGGHVTNADPVSTTVDGKLISYWNLNDSTLVLVQPRDQMQIRGEDVSEKRIQKFHETALSSAGRKNSRSMVQFVF